ncbi:hypothetical protein N1030_09860 [Desulfovibrio mangrovi]|uniref:hypothetical protein n=1 Tax=Desulfovibrio mangrovi TaxID=2976983 RepID=UPI0022469ED3|nr:hypothetical protein [Desulfovibrio mangrovi]UZP65930.1 hypothetical protein N1030_09860 [Desulfovibrio mangrovi]
MPVDLQTEFKDISALAQTEATVINHVQLILAEKRTSLSLMRTGIAVLALPLTVMGLLISTSRFYSAADMWLLLTVVLLICAGLTCLGGFLITRAVYRIRAYDHMVREIKRHSPTVAPYLD